MTKTMPISKARVNLGAVVNRVRKYGEQVILEKNGIPVAVIISINDWENYKTYKKHIVVNTVFDRKKGY